MLHDQSHTTGYCGPTAVALITGEDIRKIERRVLEHRIYRKPRRNNWRRSRKYLRENPEISVVGMWGEEMEIALAQLGYKTRRVYSRVDSPVKLTMGQFFRTRSTKDTVYLVHVTGHFLVVSDGMWADSQHRKPIPIETYKRKRTRVYTLWLVEKNDA